MHPLNIFLAPTGAQESKILCFVSFIHGYRYSRKIGWKRNQNQKRGGKILGVKKVKGSLNKSLNLNLQGIPAAKQKKIQTRVNFNILVFDF